MISSSHATASRAIPVFKTDGARLPSISIVMQDRLRPMPPQEACDIHPVTATALQDFLTANYAHLHRRLTRHLGCPDLASESLHEAWLRLGEQTSASAYAAQNREAYIYRAACNAAIDHLRVNRSWQYVGDADAEIAQCADRAPGPDAIAEARSDLEAAVRAMQRLPRLYGAILLALRVEEMPRQEVADRFGLSLRRVDTALRRALECCVLR